MDYGFKLLSYACMLFIDWVTQYKNRLLNFLELFISYGRIVKYYRGRNGFISFFDIATQII